MNYLSVYLFFVFNILNIDLRDCFADPRTQWDKKVLYFVKYRRM